MSMLRELLLANKAPVVIATVHDVGYALCEIAENPRHTSNNGVSRLAKTVRHWRIAAGLTQTAVAKQSGVNRSYLSHLETGRRNPTLATLQRLIETRCELKQSFHDERPINPHRYGRQHRGAGGCGSRCDADLR